MENETNETVAVAENAEVQAEQTPAVELRQPSTVEFCLIVNASSDRNDALKRFAEAGFKMSKSALIGRLNNYKRNKPQLKVKQLAGSRGGRKIDVDAVNAALEQAEAEKAAAAEITAEGENETVQG